MASPNFTLTGLTGYVDQNREELLSAAIAGAKSSQVLAMQTGIKGSANINLLDTDLVFQVDNVAGRTPAGVTTISKRTITVAPIKVEEDINVKGLNDTYIQHQLKAGSADDAIPFEQAWSELKAAKIAAQLETAIWQSEVGGAGGANMVHFDGFLEIIKDETANVIHSNGTSGGILTATGITSANIEAIVDGVYTSIPLELLDKDDVVIFMGHDRFRLYTQALKDSNLFHYDAKGSNFEIMVPATNVKVMALHGLNGVAVDGSPIVAARTSNMIIGVDLEHDEDVFEVWYSKDDKVVKFDAGFKYGVQIAFPAEVVEFSTNAV